MPLTIYRRHSSKCETKLRGELKLKPAETRFYRDCTCKIVLEGSTDTEVFPRRSLNTRDWKTAEAKLRKLAGESKDEAVYGLKLSDCVTKYIDSIKDAMKPKTWGQYVLVLHMLTDFAATKNKFFTQEALTVDLLTDFNTYGFAHLKSNSKATLQSKVARFLREAYIRDWITEPLVEKLKTGTAVYDEVQRYEDKEIQLIMEAAEQLNSGTTGYATCGHTFMLLLELMLQTGMRVSDAVRFQPSALVKSKHLWKYKFYPRKSKKNAKRKLVTVFLKDELKMQIENCKWFSTTLPFAYHTPAADGETDDLAQAVYERMKHIGKRTGVAKCRPHRLRHTFAIRLLLKGFLLQDVSRLLGHSSIAVTEKFYASWVQDREDALEARLSQSL